jgi:hypothetical protein
MSPQDLEIFYAVSSLSPVNRTNFIPPALKAAIVYGTKS